jgi:predicted nucleotidyltransferase
MKNDGLNKELKKKIIGILKTLFTGAKVYLYGSRARGDFHDRSDIDLAIDIGVGNERLRLGEAKSVLEGLHCPYKIDIVDLNYLSEEMKKIIIEEGVLWIE